MSEFEKLNRNKVLDYLEDLTSKIGMDPNLTSQWPKLKRHLVKKYGSVQMVDFYESLKSTPRATYGEKPSTATRYMRPSDESIADDAAEAKKIEKQKAIDFVQSFQEKNKGGVVTKKTKGFKQGGLAGTGHNDMRKGGLFKAEKS